jgi:hypothetical protein
MKSGKALREEQNIEWHLTDHRTKKWLVQCVVCQQVGYRADAPKEFFGRAHLVKYFKPLELDERGVCQTCRVAIAN